MPAIPESGGFGTRQNPIQLGTSVRLADEWQLTVVSTEPDASRRVVAQDPGNAPPPSSYQYFMASIRATNTDTAARAFQARLRLRTVGPASVTYFALDNACGVIPNPIGESPVAPGAMASGNLCWTVQARDAAALVLYDVPPLSSTDAPMTRTYFALHP
jgi:hypothetical protein